LIGHWAHRGGASALAELTRLEKKLAALSPEDTNLLQRALAEAYLKTGNRWDAERVARRVAARLPRSLRSRSFLFDLALQAGRAPFLRVWHNCYLTVVVTASADRQCDCSRNRASCAAPRPDWRPRSPCASATRSGRWLWPVWPFQCRHALWATASGSRTCTKP